MPATILKSSAIASAFGIALLGGVLTGSTLTVPDEAAKKGNMHFVASSCAECDKSSDRLTHYTTDVAVDRENGIITLERDRISD